MRESRNLKREASYLLKKYGLRPRRENGQNFLVDASIIDMLIDASGVQSGDHVLEVGAGLGVVTGALLEKTEFVVAVELDRAFAPILERFQSQHPDFQLLIEDVFETHIAELFHNQPYSVVANLPYNITSGFIRMMWTQQHRPTRMTLIIQKEVAERIVASPGNMSLLSLSVQLYAEPEIIQEISRTSFWPEPDVDSAIIRMTARTTPQVENPETLMQIARMAFAGKRKQLHNSLSAGLKISPKEVKERLSSKGINPMARPQELEVSDWQKLTEVFSR